ncbi:MAG TPA: MBOAT family protein [Steroidobacteraceae bacterium]|nr:MBOAT family protein [Steroidobacteraceae bacterium]
MLLNSIEFFVFLVAVFPVYFLAHRFGPRGPVLVLLIASLIFYAWWSVQYLWLLLLSICFNYAIGRQLLGGAPKSSQRTRDVLLAAGVATNLGLLFVFKYLDFFLRDVLGHDPLGIILPLGISFYTFTQIAFLVDARRGDVAANDPLSYGLFVTYFPHLIAGPIIHHKPVIPQFINPANHVIRPDMVSVGLALFVIGLIKKIYFADNVEPFVQPVFSFAAAGGNPGLLEAWSGTLAYTLQLYFDFSGYSDMAVGISMLFGIRLPINFESPYKANDIIEFWRRWHMTLSAFLREYLYFPLGGNRKGPARRYVNLMLTMCLGGLWHGANWTFLAWGALHGLYLIINHLARAVLPATPGLGRLVIGRCLTLLAVIVAWCFFVRIV